MGVPPAEIRITEPLVRGLLREQHPALAALPLRHAASGWDNELWRLGDDLVVRLPRRALGAGLIEHEQRWLPGLAVTVGVPTPVPLHLGGPTDDYPWRWHAARWVEGRTADRRPLAAAGARRLGEALARLHVPALPNAPHNPHRSVHISARTFPLATLKRARWDGHGGAALHALWTAACATSAVMTPCWVHGDLHVRNVLTTPGGDLAAILDWGDLCAGDPAVDLSAVWTLVPAMHEQAFRQGYGPMDAETEARARGWALVFSTIVWTTYRREDERLADGAAATLARLAAEPPRTG